MSVCFNLQKLSTMVAGAALVILGVHLKNGRQQAGDDVPMFGAGTAIFIAGWALVAYGLGLTNMAIVGAVSIVCGVMIMKMGMKDPKSEIAKYMLFGLALFIGGWVAVAWVAGGGKFNISSLKFQLAIAAFVGVMLSMLYVLPRERKEKVTDTLGMPIFTAAWVALSMAASMK